MKKPTSVIRRRAWFLSISLALSAQAMAVRRHGCPMMMVMAVMAETLHLFSPYRQLRRIVKSILSARAAAQRRYATALRW
jgi:hypothetical protein